MSHDNEKAPSSPLYPENLQSIAPATLDTPRPSVAADRLYQLAALTAGIFLLVTLL
jgi:hypothetical protein